MSVLLAALLAAAPAPAVAPVLAGPPGEEVELSCDTLSYDWGRQIVHLDGNVVARRGEGVLRAKVGTWDRAAGRILLSGGVLAVQGRQVFLADAALVDLEAHTADLSSAVLYLKERPVSEAAPTAGPNALVLHGERLRQEGQGVVVAERVRLTPCDCANRPDYELFAKEARIEGDRAHLSGVDLALFGLPLPLFPLSLPLSRRQSGLLAPQFGFGGAKGFAFAQPVFVTLGESFDATLTPGLYTGRGRGPNPFSVNDRRLTGPRLGAELRYAPWAGTAGALSIDLVDDLHASDSPGAAPPYPGETGVRPGRGFSGLRGVARFAHRTEGEKATFAVDGSAASDAAIVFDQAPNNPERFFDARRTDLGLWGDTGPLSAGAAGTLLQDQRIAGNDLDRRLIGPEARSAFQRLPSPFVRLAPVALGEAVASGEASVATFAAFPAPGPQERATGFAAVDGGSLMQGTSLQRATASRLDGAARLGWAPQVAGPVALQLSAGGRGDVWLFEAEPARNTARLYGIASVAASLPLQRTFGDLLHRVEPFARFLWLTPGLRGGAAPVGDPVDGGGLAWASRPEAAQQQLTPQLLRRSAPPSPNLWCDPAVPETCVLGVPAARRGYDELDGAAPTSGAAQLVTGLRQSLWRSASGHPARVLRLDLTQDALLWTRGGAARLGEAAGVVEWGLGRFWGNVYGRYDWSQRVVTTWGTGVGLSDARGDIFGAGASAVRANTSSEALRAGVDELFSTARLDANAGPFSGVANVTLAATPPGFANLRLQYTLLHHLDAQAPDVGQQFHKLDLSLQSACQCARVVLALAHAANDVVRPVGGFQIDFLLDLKSLGTLSSF